MPINKLEELNYVELRELDKHKTVFFFTIPPKKEPAPSLPIGTDIFTSSFFAQTSAEELIQTKPDWNVVMIPPLYLGTYVFKFVGSVVHRQRIILEVLKNYGKTINSMRIEDILYF